MRYVALLTLLVCFAAPPDGVPAQKDELGQRIDRIFRRWNRPDTPGVALAVARAGKVVFKRGYGSANLEYEIPIAPTTTFHVASVSKQVTAFAVAMLGAQGKLTLDDDIRKHVPEVPDFGEVITLRQLIHHTSGLRDQWELICMSGGRLDDVITRDRILRLVARQRALNFSPGAEHLYCNTGYTLLAEVVARVTGKSFPVWTKANLFEPLGMANTHFHDDHRALVAGRAYSYARRPLRGYVKRVLSYANAGATSLFSTPEDLLRWCHNLDTGKVGGEAVVKQMHERGRLKGGDELRYAFGLVHQKRVGHAAVLHGGADAGFRAMVIRFPAHDIAVVVLGNVATLNVDALATRVARLFLPAAPKKAKLAEATPPVPGPKRVAIDAGKLDDYVGMFQLRPGWVLTISKKRRGLKVRASREGTQLMVPTGPDRFFVPAYKRDIVFKRNAEQTVTHLLYRGIRAPRTQRFRPDVDALAAFTGTYWSPELDTSYDFTVRDGKLVAEHIRQGRLRLTPTLSDHFRGPRFWFRSVQFERNESGDVTGFRLSGARVRNLAFVRH